MNDFERLLQLTDQALADASAEDRPMRLNTRAGVLYRAGRFEAALETLREAMALHGDNNGDGGTPQDWLFLAMAHHHLGHGAEAARWLDHTREWLQVTSAEGPEDKSDKSMNRADELEIELLLREAEQLIESE